jgi:16S rRNA (adenine1518-N6/adenine1519-N6)-dimethyltransferase
VGRPKRRRLGQNFLADPGVADRIARQLHDEPPRVLEIGPGRGALTIPLLARFSRVLGLELDANLVPDLESRFARDGFEIRHGDALREDLDSLVGDEGRWQVASNLPYSVGTAILRRLLPRHDLFDRIVVMLQKEVAQRVVARPGESGHGLLALERAAWSEARCVFDVPPQAFRPRPKITSTVLVVDPRPAPVEQELLSRALSLAAHALTRPRKTLSNALKPRLDSDAIAAAEVDPQVRPGTLDLAAWCRLATTLDR